MAVELDHRFTTSRPIDESLDAVTDLERVIPCVEGGRVLETTGPDSARAEIAMKMGAMSLTFTGTVEVGVLDEPELPELPDPELDPLLDPLALEL